jgi:cytochrome P450
MLKYQDATWADIGIRAAPHEFLASLRAESPVYFDRQLNGFIVTRYDDQRYVLRTEDIFSSQTGVLFARYKTSERSAEIEAMYMAEGCLPIDVLITVDPPAHSRYRRPVQEAFLPKRLSNMRVAIESYANALIDEVIGQGRCDYSKTVAIPLPVAVIARELGVPPEDYPIFKQWSDDIIEHVHPWLKADREVELVRSFIGMQRYFFAKIDELSRNPARCLLSDMIQSASGEGGLNVQEIISIVMLLVLAGNETTGNALGWAMWHLLRDPALAERLRADLDGDAIERFVEEVLRINPTAMTFRIAVADTEIGDVPISKGSMIYMPLMSGNHDEAMFPDASAIQLERKNTSRHLTFGQGIHICLGMHLARMEMVIGVRETLRRMKNIRPDSRGEPVLNTAFGVWGLVSLPILFDAA